MKFKEENLVQKISSILNRHPDQINEIYESDSEIVKINDSYYSFNIDEFSSKEDFFSDFIPSILGHNLILATLSDLYATGAKPEFFLHTFCVTKKMDDIFMTSFLEGISKALQANNTFALGGDISTDDNWRYTGFCMGKANRPIKRIGAKSGDQLFSTGKFGAGNRQALLLYNLDKNNITPDNELKKLCSPKFNLLSDKAETINKYANFAIDTSDGLIETIFDLLRVNKTVGFNIVLKEDLFDPISKQLITKENIPPELLLFGSAGEYEIIFGVNSSNMKYVQDKGFSTYRRSNF